MTDPIAESVRKLLRYNPETGKLRWIKFRSGARASLVAGGINSGGYRQIMVLGKNYKAHRLAWLIYYGEWPRDQIDHKDRNRLNNRIDNLREANQFQQRGNSYGQSAIGLPKGVGMSRNGRFEAKIKISGHQHCLGTFDTPEAAHAAYCVAAKAHFGEYFYGSE